MKKVTRSERLDRAREGARLHLRIAARNKSLGAQELLPITLAEMADWKSANLNDLVDRAPNDRAAWEACIQASLHRDSTEPGMDRVRNLIARFMTGDVKRPPQKRKFISRDWTIAVAIEAAGTSAATNTSAGAWKRDGSLTIAFNAVADVLDELGVRDADGREFTTDAIKAIWTRMRRLVQPPAILPLGKSRTGSR